MTGQGPGRCTRGSPPVGVWGFFLWVLGFPRDRVLLAGTAEAVEARLSALTASPGRQPSVCCGWRGAHRRASGCSCSTTCTSTGCVAPAPPPPQHRVSCLTARRSPPARLSRPAELLSLPAAVSLRPCPCAFTPLLFLPAGLGRADRAVHCTCHAELTQRRPVSISQSVATLPTSSVMVCTAHSSGPAGRSFPGPREGAHCSTQWPCGGPAGTLGCH